MKFHPLKKLTIICESVLESTVVDDIERLGAHGFTVSNVRGKGSRGMRASSWDANSSIRIEVICEPATAEAIAAHLQAEYYENYAMILFLADVEVLRSGKF